MTARWNAIQADAGIVIGASSVCYCVMRDSRLVHEGRSEINSTGSLADALRDVINEIRSHGGIFTRYRVAISATSSRWKRLQGLSPDDLSRASFEVAASPERFFIVPFPKTLVSSVSKDPQGNLHAAAFDGLLIEQLSRTLATTRVRRVRFCAAHELLASTVPESESDSLDAALARRAADRALKTRSELGREALSLGRASLPPHRLQLTLFLCLAACCGFVGTHLIYAMDEQRFQSRYANAAARAARNRAVRDGLANEYGRLRGFQDRSALVVQRLAEVSTVLDTLGTVSSVEMQGDSMDIDLIAPQVTMIPGILVARSSVLSAEILGGLRRDEEGDGDEHALVRVRFAPLRNVP